jgi:hypothetical protein
MSRCRNLNVLTLVLVMTIIFFSYHSIIQPRKDFYNNLWAPAHLLIRGESPYDTASLAPDLPAVWMPMAVGMFVPLGLLPPETASSLWFLLNAAGLIALVLLSMPKPLSIGALAAGILFAALFPPFLQHAMLGQISILSALFLMTAAKFAEKRWDWAAACFLAAGLSKPQIGFLIMLGIGLCYFQQGGLRLTVRFGLKTLTAITIMCLPLFASQPDWYFDWLASLQSNRVAWMHPSILYQLRQLLGNWGYFPWACITIATVWVALWLWKTRPSHEAALWSLALTLLITPYVWSWDFILLLPLFIHTFSRTGWKYKAILAAGYVVGWTGMAVIQLSANDHNSRFWWVPLWFLVIIGSIYLKSLNDNHSPKAVDKRVGTQP